MSRKTGRRRGRPRLTHAKRRATTRQGRLTGVDPVDQGSSRLLHRKSTIANGRTDLPLDGAGVLFAHDLIDREQFDRLGAVTHWLQMTARGGRDGSVGGLWSAIIAAATRMGSAVAPAPAGSDAARFRLARALSRLNGSRELVVELAEGRVPPLVLRVLDRRLTARDREELERLRYGLDRM